MNYSTDTLFKRHFPNHSNAPLLALGMLQWGTTPIDHCMINGSRGVLTEDEAQEIYQTFRSRGVVLFDTAEGYGGGTSEKRLGRLWREEFKSKSTLLTQGKDECTATSAADSDRNVVLMTKFLPVPWR